MAGRPSKFNDKTVPLAKEYLETYASQGHMIPSIQGLALFLDVAESTIYKWADENAQFSGMLDKIRTNQHMVLLNNGLNGQFNAAITKLVLSKHGYHETVKADHTVNDYTNMTSEDRQRRLMELQQQIENAERG